MRSWRKERSRRFLGASRMAAWNRASPRPKRRPYRKKAAVRQRGKGYRNGGLHGVLQRTVSALHPPLEGEGKKASVIARILCDAGCVVAENPIRPPSKIAPRARGTPSGLPDPRASTPRDIEACRSVSVPQVRQSIGVPRAVFIGLLRSFPGGRTVSGTLPLRVRVPIHRYEPARLLHDCPGRVAGGEWAGPGDARQAHRDAAVWTAGRENMRRISDAPTAPRPASGDADQTPLGFGAGWRGI